MNYLDLFATGPSSTDAPTDKKSKRRLDLSAIKQKLHEQSVNDLGDRLLRPDQPVFELHFVEDSTGEALGSLKMLGLPLPGTKIEINGARLRIKRVTQLPTSNGSFFDNTIFCEVM